MFRLHQISQLEALLQNLTQTADFTPDKINCCIMIDT